MGKTKIRSIDLFAGCGGLMDGFEQSGAFDTIAAVEWEKVPCKNLENRMREKWHYPDAETRVLRFDIQRTNELFAGWKNDKEYGSSVGLDKLIDAVGVIDVVIGGPPCQAYSIAGRVRDEFGMKNDYRNYLFESYIKVLDRYKPKAFIFENVPGILSAKPGDRPIIDIIQESFNEAGYLLLSNLAEAIIDFTDYGVPQNRKRIIIFGVRKDAFGDRSSEAINYFYKVALPKHKTMQKKTVYEAIGDLPKLYPLSEDIKVNSSRTRHSLPERAVPNHVARWQSDRDIGIFKLLTEDIESGRNRYTSIDLTSMMTGAKGGYKLSEYDEDGRWVRDLYMDTQDKATAKRILQINKDGIAASTSGYEGPYTVGITVDGQIQGSWIAANSIDTDHLSIGLNTTIQGLEDERTHETTAKGAWQRMAKKITAIPATISKYTATPINSTKKRRVAGYARVSTDHEDQATSYEAQVDYYTNYIKGRDDWEFVGIYTDESAIIGLSQNPIQTGGDIALFFLFSAQFSANEGVPA